MAAPINIGKWALKITRKCWNNDYMLNSLCTSVAIKRPVLKGKIDNYNGIFVNVEQIAADIPDETFDSILRDSLESWQEKQHTCVWLQVPIMHSKFIPLAAKSGFQFHHAEDSTAMLCKWLQSSPSLIPRFATHQVGVAGFVWREDTKEILVIQDKNKRRVYWKFPGGLADLGEDIGETAVRETFEETGIQTEFKSVMSFRQQHNQPGAFGRSDFYFICRLAPSTFHIQPCHNEVLQCRWMAFEDLANNDQITPITKQFLKVVKNGLEHGFHTVDIKNIELKSIYKGLKYKMYHRPVS